MVSLLLVSVFAVGLGAFPTSGARKPGGLQLRRTRQPRRAAVRRADRRDDPVAAVVDAGRRREAVTSDAVRAALSRGIGGWTPLRGHVAPVSVLPTLALLGTRLPELIAGAAIVETVFWLAGLAESLVDSAVALDFPLLAALAVGAAALVLIGSALSDAAAVWIDPPDGTDGMTRPFRIPEPVPASGIRRPMAVDTARDDRARRRALADRGR